MCGYCPGQSGLDPAVQGQSEADGHVAHARACLSTTGYELGLLGMMLPPDRIELPNRLRRDGLRVQVIVITARDPIDGLNARPDDYLVNSSIYFNCPNEWGL